MNPHRHFGEHPGHRNRGRGGHGPFGDPSRGPRHHRGGGRMRAQRGDVRTAVLLLLGEQPMHGYQLMQGIAERTGGSWTPSPGAVYPTINQLEDEGLVTVTAESGRKLVTLTDAGREHLTEHRATWADPFEGYEASAPGQDLRLLMHELHEATRVLGRTGNDEQRAAAAKILSDARRSLYLLLANGSTEAPDA